MYLLKCISSFLVSLSFGRIFKRNRYIYTKNTLKIYIIYAHYYTDILTHIFNPYVQIKTKKNLKDLNYEDLRNKSAIIGKSSSKETASVWRTWHPLSFCKSRYKSKIINDGTNKRKEKERNRRTFNNPFLTPVMHG